MASVESVAAYFVYSVRWDTSLTLSAFTILYYDYAMTVFSEIEYYWSPPAPSLSFLLFVINRYVGLLGPIPVFFEYFAAVSEHVGLSRLHRRSVGSRSCYSDGSLKRPDCEHRCRQLQLYHQIFAMFSQAIVAILLILRTYALYKCSKRMLALLIGMHIGGAIHCLSAVLTSKSPLTTDTPLGFSYALCNLSLTDDHVDLALAWSAMLWFDTIIFLLTLFKAVQMRRELAGGLLEILFRDGISILVAVNMVNIITFLGTRAISSISLHRDDRLSVTLTSRLMLNLRDPSLQRGRRPGGTTRLEAWSTGQFTSRAMSFTCPATDLESVSLDDVGSYACTSD
ncbi:hypothetical protein OH77DRAFT_1491693 [Trametes cingulata]|nr:hypothetical protein OH77DRAFT_1491693 [Trametes cingulata]